MNASSSGVMSSFRKIGWYRGMAAKRRMRSRISFGIHVQAFGNQVGVGTQVARGITQQQRGERRIVVDDVAAFAVENLAARGENRHIANAVFLRQAGVLVALRHLQTPQPISQDQENGQDDVLHRSEADRRNFFITAKHKSVVGPWSLVLGLAEVALL